MKRLFIVLTAIGASTLVIQTTQASLLFSEAFNYTARTALRGQINPGNSITWNGGNSGLTIGSGNLTYDGLTDQGGNELSIANATAGSTDNSFANQSPADKSTIRFIFDLTTS